MKITMDQLCDYCIEQGIKNTGLSMKEKESWKEFYRGRAMAFMWIAACIQNDNIPELEED